MLRALGVLLSQLAVARAPNSLWAATPKCDMLSPARKHGEPSYVDGTWEWSTGLHPGITQTLPMECVESTRPAPYEGRSDLGATSPSNICPAAHAPCYSSRSNAAFQNRLRGLQYAWHAKKECRFTPLGKVNNPTLRSWSAAIEANAGPMLWVGDRTLAQMFMAWDFLTGGATNSYFHTTGSLVNSYTLQTMSCPEVKACAAAQPNPAVGLHCPPVDGGLYAPYGDGSHHTLNNMYWTCALNGLHEGGTAGRYKTLILNVGQDWWKEYLYPARYPAACQTSGGSSDAHKPTPSLDLPLADYPAAGCDVFGDKYPLMVQGVARYLQRATLFSGHVVLVTTPPGVDSCGSLTAPNQPGFPSTDPPGTIPFTQARYHYEKFKYAEAIWKTAFAQFSILNISHMSELRGDVRTPSDCAQFCYPGPSFNWAEMLLRLLEQDHELNP